MFHGSFLHVGLEVSRGVESNVCPIVGVCAKLMKVHGTRGTVSSCLEREDLCNYVLGETSFLKMLIWMEHNVRACDVNFLFAQFINFGPITA
jgi:hypothetical protein